MSVAGYTLPGVVRIPMMCGVFSTAVIKSRAQGVLKLAVVNGHQLSQQMLSWTSAFACCFWRYGNNSRKLIQEFHILLKFATQ